MSVTTAVDTNILLDIALWDADFGQASLEALTLVTEQGPLVISPIVVAELSAAFPSPDKARSHIASLPIEVSLIDVDACLIAGTFWRRRNQERRSRILPDYLIAAQAAVSADRLLTRDKGFRRLRIPNLVVVTPQELLAQMH